MDILPYELLFEIFKNLEFIDIIHCGMTNQWINSITKKDVLWYEKLKNTDYKIKINSNRNSYQRYMMLQKRIKLYE